MTGPVEGYLRQLRASLRTPPGETSRILAEAEDHLAESVAAGLAAGLTETEAAEAAISSFGSVRAVVRAHQTRRGRIVAALSGLAMTTWLLAGIVLVSVFAVGVVLVVVMLVKGPQNAGSPDPDPGGFAFFVVFCGLAGLGVLLGYVRARRFQRRRGRRPQAALQSAYAPLAGTVLFAGLAVTLAVATRGGITAHHVVRQACAIGSVAAAATFAALTRRRLRDRRRAE